VIGRPLIFHKRFGAGHDGDGSLWGGPFHIIPREYRPQNDLDLSDPVDHRILKQSQIAVVDITNQERIRPCERTDRNKPEK